MIIEGKQYQSIWYDAQKAVVKIIDQTALPHRFEILSLNSLDDACHAISSMQVRGAPLVGVTAAYGLFLALRQGLEKTKSVKKLLATRPTAVNLQWALQRMEEALSEFDPEDGSGLIECALGCAQQLERDDIAICEAIGNHGAEVFEKCWQEKKHSSRESSPVDERLNCLNVLTHCNAGALATVDWGTALAVIYKAHARGIPLHVWVDETRPRNQGASLTCWELGQHGIDHTLVVDNVGGHLMQQGMVDVCVIGSDRTTAKGDVCNKIGSYLKALAAFDNNIPFYAAVPVSSIDFQLSNAESIPIELRGAEEVTHMTGVDAQGVEHTVQIAAPGSKAINYGFDVTPARLVSGIITEHGLFAANQQGLAGLVSY